MTSSSDPVQQAFETAVQNFKSKLNNDKLFNDILATKTVDQVYDVTDAIQKEQVKQGHLRHLSKIQPYLDGLSNYAAVIEVFMQAKPDVLALIWGPLKLIIQWATVLKQSFDAIVNITAEIGLLLPEFRQVSKLFDKNQQVKEIMVLFFKDMLDFYLIVLTFFSLSRWKYFFESLWPKHRGKIRVVEGHIQRLTLLLRNEVRMEHIQEEHQVRNRALEHFDQTEKHQRRQDFDRIRADICPKTYEDKRYHLQGRVCHGTGKWLLGDATFTKWLDMTQTSMKFLWLQGIPGAGKTYLSSTVLDTTSSLGRTVFAFLSYTNSSNTTAISILHSLIFQLAEYCEDLQDVVSECSRKTLKSSIDSAAHLMTTLVACAGPVYIIIDGLDEMNEFERGVLTKQLVLLSKTSDNAMILASSRMEDDISNIINDVAARIRVDHCNSGSIQTFINQHVRTWYQIRCFPPETKAEIDGLLAPLAATSKGMFLYARIVLSNIEYLEVCDIRQELQVLPECLDDAYFRILTRVNNLKPPRLMEKARKLLGWVGCTPTPLTVQELEHALIVSPDDIDGTARVQANLNITRYCGPIVEVYGDCVQFVHFTVKEYLFSPKIPGYIDSAEATLSLTTSCLMYLCQRHHDVDLEDEVVRLNLLRGAYRLHNFAANWWFVLIQRSIRGLKTSELPKGLIEPLQLLVSKRYNDSWGGSSNGSIHPTFDYFKSIPSEVQVLLDGAVVFLKSCKNSDFSMHRAHNWTKLDPLTTSAMSARIYHQLESTACSTLKHGEHCACQILVMHYGRRYFKCGFVSCTYRRSGFETRIDRDSHMRHHDRPWKCSVVDCEYAEGGFLSRKMRDDHLDLAHQDEASQKMLSTKNLDADELQPLIFDIIRGENVEMFRVLVPEFKKFPRQVQTEACRIAAISGFTSILEKMPLREIHRGMMLAEAKKFGSLMMTSSIQSGNIATVNSVLSQFAVITDYRNPIATLLSDILRSDSNEIYEEWERNVDFEVQRGKFKQTPRASDFLTTDIIKATARQMNREEYLIEIWKKLNLQESCGSKYPGDALVNVATSTCSINLATFLLDLGADVDHRRSSKYRTPLHHAARHNSAAAAEFMKFLLLRGANPNPKVDRLKDSLLSHELLLETGVRNISQWLNVSWDELIANVKDERQNTSSNIMEIDNKII